MTDVPTHDGGLRADTFRHRAGALGPRGPVRVTGRPAGAARPVRGDAAGVSARVGPGADTSRHRDEAFESSAPGRRTAGPASIAGAAPAADPAGGLT